MADAQRFEGDQVIQGENDGTRPANAVPNVTEEVIAEVPREEGSDASSASSWDADMMICITSKTQ